MEQVALASVEVLRDRGVEKVRINLVKGDRAIGFMRPLKPKPKITR